MCDQCNSDSPKPSRRTLLKIAAATAAVALAGCEAHDPLELPDAYKDHLTTEQPGGAVKIDRSKIVKQPETRPAQTEYGSILPRSAWTASPLTLRNGIPMESITKITIHHSGDGKPFLGESIADVSRHLQIVQQAHLQRGMVDIAYHFAIDRAGRAWQLRYLQYEGQHVRPSKNGTHNNPHNVGIVMLGDFNLQNPTAVQRDRLFDMIGLLRTKYTPPPRPPLPAYMHGEIVDTDCPGKNLEPAIFDARRRRIL